MEQVKYILVPAIFGIVIFSASAGRLYIGISQISLMFIMVVFLMVLLLFILERKIRLVLRSGELFYD